MTKSDIAQKCTGVMDKSHRFDRETDHRSALIARALPDPPIKEGLL